MSSAVTSPAPNPVPSSAAAESVKPVSSSPRNTSSTQNQSISSTPQPQIAAPVSRPQNDKKVPDCTFVYGKSKTARYAQRYDRVGHPDEITKVAFVGICLGAWIWKSMSMVLVFFSSLLALSTIASVTQKRYEELRGRSRWLFNTILKVGCRMVLFLMGIWHVKKCRVSKQEFDRIRERYTEIPREAEKEVNYPPFYVVSNHSSLADPAVCMYVYGPLSVVAKKSLRKVPLLGTICELIQCLFVGGDNQKTVEKMFNREQAYIEKVKNAPKKKFHRKVPPQMLVFPEGTVTNGKQIIRFHGGAFKNGKAVQPLLITYPYRSFNMSWVNLGFSYFPYLLGQLYNNCEVYELPPYVPNEEEKEDWKLYAYNVQRVMVDVANMYKHDDEKMFASDELFFRHAPRKKESESNENVQEQPEQQPQEQSQSVPSVRSTPAPRNSVPPSANSNDELVVVVQKPSNERHPAAGHARHSKRFSLNNVAGRRDTQRESLSDMAQRLNTLTDDLSAHFSVTGDSPDEFVSVRDDMTPATATTTNPRFTRSPLTAVSGTMTPAR